MTADAHPEHPPILRVFNTPEETRHYYNKIAKIYDLMAEHSEAPMREKGIAALEIEAGSRVLEIGCGTGHCLVDLARKVGEEGAVVGLDLSDGMIEESRQTLEKAGLLPRVELVQGNGLSVPADPESFDAVFMSFTLELFDTPKIPDLLSECRRVLRKGGKIGVVAMSHEGEEDLLMKVYEWSHRHFPNYVDCRPIYAERSLREAGFEIVSSERAKMWVPVEIVVGRKLAG